MKYTELSDYAKKRALAHYFTRLLPIYGRAVPEDTVLEQTLTYSQYEFDELGKPIKMLL